MNDADKYRKALWEEMELEHYTEGESEYLSLLSEEYKRVTE